MRALPLPSRDKLLESFTYNPDTGNLHWKVAMKNYSIGDVAGWKRKDYGYRVKLGNVTMRAARVIWKMHYDEEPEDIDHIDLDMLNNCLWNLRASEHGQNCYNKGIYKNNTTGAKGITKVKGDIFRVRIGVGNARIHIGRFGTISEAKAAYLSASERYHGEFGRVE